VSPIISKRRKSSGLLLALLAGLSVGILDMVAARADAPGEKPEPASATPADVISVISGRTATVVIRVKPLDLATLAPNAFGDWDVQASLVPPKLPVQATP
jgi:hypothetical protein